MQGRAPYIWAALVIPAWLVAVYCTHWEPVLRDTWGHYLWHVHIPLTLRSAWEFARDSYLHNNPRLGQTLTMLIATPGPWHSIVTPVVELLLFVQLTALALGRWPSPQRVDDALMFAVIFALVAVAAPQLGPMLFYRPFTGNYLFGLVIDLAFVLPYRFQLEQPRSRRWWWTPIMLVAGAAAGLSNEHTGPTCMVVAWGAAFHCWRRDQRPSAWMIAGIVGVVAGGILLLVAPGQEIRYNGLATHEGLLARIASRGLIGDVGVVLAPLWYAWKMVAGLALGLVAWWIGGKQPLERRRIRSAAAIALAAFSVSLTLLVSPKQGARLHFASVCLLGAAAASLIVPVLREPRVRFAVWLLSALSIAYMLLACLWTYSIVGPQAARRLAALEQAPKGTVLKLETYSLLRSRWFLGEDFGVASERGNIAANFGLAGIELQGSGGVAGSDEDHGK